MMKRRLVFLSFVALAMLAVLRGRATAEPTAATPTAVTAKPDSEGFVPVAPGEQLSPGESIPASSLVAGAYGFILTVLVAWVASVAVRARRVEEELVALRAKIDRKA